MASSGVKVNDDCLSKYNDMKLKHDRKFLIYKITDDKKSIEICEEGDKNKTFDDFVDSIKDCKEPRYAVLDFDYTTNDGRPQEKLCFVFWSPDNGPVAKKMLYAASKDAIRKRLTGIHAEIQANDFGDLSKDCFEGACKR